MLQITTKTVPPIIDEEDGSITTTATTSAGSYRVTITPDGITILGNPITVDFYVSVKPANIGELDTSLQQAITDYGLTGDFNYDVSGWNLGFRNVTITDMFKDSGVTTPPSWYQ